MHTCLILVISHIWLMVTVCVCVWGSEVLVLWWDIPVCWLMVKGFSLCKQCCVCETHRLTEWNIVLFSCCEQSTVMEAVCVSIGFLHFTDPLFWALESPSSTGFAIPHIVLIPQWLSHIEQSGQAQAAVPFLGMSCEEADAVLPENKVGVVWKLWNA